MKVLRRIVFEADRVLPHEPAGPPEVILAAQFVVLEEHEHVILVDFDYPDVHRPEVDRLEGKDEAGGIGKDVARERKLHCGLGFPAADLGLVVAAQGSAVLALEILGNGDRDLLFGILIVKGGDVVFGVYVCLADSADIEHAGPVPLGGERLAEDNFDNLPVVIGFLCAEHAERSGGSGDGHPDLVARLEFAVFEGDGLLLVG